MKKKWLWIFIISLNLPHQPLLSSELSQKQQFLLQKRHEKIECRLEKNKGKKTTYFLKKKMLLDKKYALKQKRLLNKKEKIPHKQYAKIEKNIQNWYDRELKQLTYQQEKFKKRIAQHEGRLTNVQ